MSINMKVLPVSDDEIARVAVDPRKLDDSAYTSAAADLYEHWREIDYLLGGNSFLVTGDVVVKSSINEPAHAVRSERVPALVAHLDSISDGDVRERLSAERMRAAGLHVSRFHNVDNKLRDIAPAMYELRAAVARAAAEHHGLVVWRFEWL